MMVKFKRDYYVEQEPYNFDFTFKQGYSYESMIITNMMTKEKNICIWNIDKSVEITLDKKECAKYLEGFDE